MEKKRLNVWVEAELYDRALERAKTEDLTLSQVIRRFLRQYITLDKTDAPSQGLRETPVDED
ncbi:MAG: hypothetical protein JW892_08005 [Anaerolineae bacterium]|nr:hypothetical protein [Anaerolineae bacterium]